ncbi:LacI family DNA-binding transcriptional regulator [Saccharopolyspora sp. NPDC047091]|uniref:LacI family DNA-binding transcriptional regulator n=1 Tax=Saccharopolyspora sp. NPDC047091 TaxID=3155924 RepID=UPI003400BC17
MKRPTIIDIARQVGVSKAAVSYALNGRAGVSAATRERILDVAAQLGWDAAGPARTPAADRTGTIGLVLARPPQHIRAEPSVVHWMAGLEAALAEYGLSLHLALPPDEEAELGTYRAWAAERRVDGVIVTDLRAEDPRVPLLRELKLPAVVIGEHERVANVAVLRFAAADEVRAVVAHLAELGHRRIGHVQGGVDLEHTARRSGLLRAEVRERLGTDLVKVEADATEDGGVRATARLLAADPPPTAIVYDDDVMAVAAVARAAELDVRVPTDLAVLSWQDSMLCRVVTPPVTALSRDVEDDAAAAVHLLLELIETGAADDLDVPPRVLLPRASTAGGA